MNIINNIKFDKLIIRPSVDIKEEDNKNKYFSIEIYRFIIFVSKRFSD
jgi:hypothetical protein